MATIRRKIKLRANQQWSPRLLKILDDKAYYDWRIAEYEAGAARVRSTWDKDEMYEAKMGNLNPNEIANARYVYETEVMTDEEYNEWATISGQGVNYV